MNVKAKRKHWRAFQDEKPLNTSPVLEFDIFIQ